MRLSPSDIDDLNLDGMSADERLVLAGEILASIDFSEIWDKTRPVEITFSEHLRSNLMYLEPDLAQEIHERADELGRDPEALVAEWIRAGLAAR